MPILGVDQLYELVRRHGATSGLDRSLVAGALEESGGNTDARGDWEGDHPHAIGLWQLHDQGAGAAMTVAQRANPDVACDVMLPLYRQWWDYWQAQGLTDEELAARTYLWAERPLQYNVPGSAADVGIRRKWLEASAMADNVALRDAVMQAAAGLHDIPYRMDPPPDGVNTLDCSLFVVKAFANAGAPFPLGVRTAEQIRRVCDPIPWATVQRGDLLFFEHTYDATEALGPDGHLATHIGISNGAGTLSMWDCHASNGDSGPPGVGQTNISGQYWQDHIFEARRPRQYSQPAVGAPGTPASPPAAALASVLGYLQNDVSDALQSALDNAKNLPDGPDRQAAFSALQAAINTLRRGGAPQGSPAPL